jgi:hypothetical protein
MSDAARTRWSSQKEKLFSLQKSRIYELISEAFALASVIDFWNVALF